MSFIVALLLCGLVGTSFDVHWLSSSERERLVDAILSMDPNCKPMLDGARLSVTGSEAICAHVRQVLKDLRQGTPQDLLLNRRQDQAPQCVECQDAPLNDALELLAKAFDIHIQVSADANSLAQRASVTFSTLNDIGFRGLTVGQTLDLVLGPHRLAWRFGKDGIVVIKEDGLNRTVLRVISAEQGNELLRQTSHPMLFSFGRAFLICGTEGEYRDLERGAPTVDKYDLVFGKWPKVFELSQRLPWGTGTADEKLKKLKSAEKRRRLDLSKTSITDLGLLGLARFTNVVDLDLSDCNHLTGDGLTTVAKMKTLRQVDLSNCKVLTDVGLGYLSTSQSLQNIHLVNCPNVTDIGLLAMQNVSTLRQLNVRDCKNITRDGVDGLRRKVGGRVRILSDCDGQPLPRAKKLDE